MSHQPVSANLILSASFSSGSGWGKTSFDKASRNAQRAEKGEGEPGNLGTWELKKDGGKTRRANPETADLEIGCTWPSISAHCQHCRNCRLLNLSSSSTAGEDDAFHSFQCPITLNVMDDAVTSVPAQASVPEEPGS
jgi:hypothetical protein